MPTTVVTDYTFDDLSVETAILQAKGIALQGQKTGKDQAKTIELVRDADAVITQFAPINAEVIAAMRKAKVIVRYGIGVDNVDLKAAAAKGIPVSNIPDYCIDEVADHTLGMMLALTRALVPNILKVRSGSWGLAGPLDNLHALRDMTIGLIAFGRIAREVATRLKGFKCRVLVHDPTVEAETIRAAGCEPASLDQVLAQSDLLSLHCPSVDATRYMINAQTIARMKRGALLVNTSRGTLVKTEDLAAALRSGHITAAALDVTDPEPPPAGHPLVGLENVIITSHYASATPQAAQRLRDSAAQTVVTVLTGGKAPNVVNGVKV